MKKKEGLFSEWRRRKGEKKTVKLNSL